MKLTEWEFASMLVKSGECVLHKTVPKSECSRSYGVSDGWIDCTFVASVVTTSL